MKSFEELIAVAKKSGKKKCVVIMAQDTTVLEGIKLAQEHSLIYPVLVGDESMIKELSKKVGLDMGDVEIHHTREENEALKKGILLVKDQGDFLMKGMISTSVFLKGVLNREWGLRTGKILSHIAVLEVPGYHKLIFMSDGGMNPKLDFNIRLNITTNAIRTLHMLGIKEPKIGLVSASETIHPDMPETTDAAEIVRFYNKGEIKNCIIEGPFGFDVSISKQAADHKKIQSRIAGDVDFLLMPSISAANIWAKGLIIFANAKAAGMVAGAARPVIMLSRADKPETKLNSIALGVALSTPSPSGS
ncbi:MAG: phosphate acyltransferase [bacterium]